MTARVLNQRLQSVRIQAPILGVGRIRIEVRSENGLLLSEHEQECNSYVKNMLRLYSMWLWRHDTSVTLDRVAGGTGSYSGVYCNTATTDGRGLVIGSSGTADAWTDVALGTRIVTGSGAGQLTPQTQNWSEAVASGVVTQTIIRNFVNTSGGNVTVRECGLYGTLSTTATDVTNPVMLLRDTFADQVVPNNGSFVLQIDLAGNAGSGSFLGQNSQTVLWRMFNGVSTHSVVRITGVGDTEQGTYHAAPTTNTFTQGIRVGTSNTAHSKSTGTTFALGAAVGIGSGAGQLVHTVCSQDAIVFGASDGYARLRRSFVNNTGSTITLQEAGLYGSTTDTSGGQRYYLGGKVLDASVAVLATEGVEFLLDLTMAH